MIKEKVTELILARAKMSENREMKEDDDLIYDLGLDSLSLVELIMDIETEFDIEIEEEDIENVYKYGKLLNYIEKRIKCDE